VRITYDPQADAAYIQVVSRILPGEATLSISSITTPGGKGEINLDFDANGQLLGIEVLFASDVLPRKVLSEADPPGS